MLGETPTGKTRYSISISLMFSKHNYDNFNSFDALVLAKDISKKSYFIRVLNTGVLLTFSRTEGIERIYFLP